MKKYNIVIFDLDGTLLDTIQDITNAINNTLDEVGILSRIDNNVTKAFIGNGATKLMERIFSYLSLNELQQDKFRSLYFENYSKEVNKETKPFDGVKETLLCLKSKGYKLGVISNKPHVDALKSVEMHFENIFDFVVGKQENVAPKPNKEVFDSIEYLKNINRKEIVYVGDMQVDIIFSENINVDVIICKHGYGKYHEMSNYNYLINNFNELINILENEDEKKKL